VPLHTVNKGFSGEEEKEFVSPACLAKTYFALAKSPEGTGRHDLFYATTFCIRLDQKQFSMLLLAIAVIS
jgi:hypothetical protein